MSETLFLQKLPMVVVQRYYLMLSVVSEVVLSIVIGRLYVMH